MIEQTKVNNLIELISLRKKDKLLAKKAYLNRDLISKAYDIDNISFNDSVLVIDAVEILPYLYRNGITDVTYIQYGKVQDEKIPTTDMLGYNYINISNKKQLGEINMGKKFDVILSNPSYNSNTDKKFFNTAYNQLKEDGAMSIIQPSRLNTFAQDITIDDNNMLDIIENNHTTVKLIAPTEIENFYLFYLLTCTTIKKSDSKFKGVEEFTDLSGNVYNNVDINGINFTNIVPNIYKSIVAKIEALINQYGGLSNIIYSNTSGDIEEGKKVLRLSTSSGHYGSDNGNGYTRSKSFFTWIPVLDDNGIPVFKSKNISDFGVAINKDIDEKTAYSYFTTFFARFCMTLGKNGHRIINSKCIDTTPNLGFDKVWTDEGLFELAGFTEEEIAVVYAVIPKFH